MRQPPLTEHQKKTFSTRRVRTRTHSQQHSRNKQQGPSSPRPHPSPPLVIAALSTPDAVRFSATGKLIPHPHTAARHTHRCNPPAAHGFNILQDLNPSPHQRSKQETVRIPERQADIAPSIAVSHDIFPDPRHPQSRGKARRKAWPDTPPTHPKRSRSTQPS